MYLKNIEVVGFKSFAQKINFEFHNGITGIVGPNGSGKSNVADAVRWVLGEQSAKQLRGGNMQDVIFSGTENRKPLSYASVAITLDNSDKKLSVDYEEVTVTRRLYRSGESEYLINGSSCRLKDINEMFYDTGIGKEGYSIIGQGQIDRILSGKPEERRELFDEAAGIVKFKRRKNTALKKLDEEQQNLLRVTDILSELTKQLGPLEKQAEAAKIYLSKKETLKNLDVNMFLLETAYIREQLQSVEERFKNAKGNLEDANVKFERTKQEYERLEQDMEALDEKIEEARGQASKNAILKEQLEGQINVLREQINAGHKNDEHFQSRQTAIENNRRKSQEELSEYAKEKDKLEEQLQAVLKKQETEELRIAEVNREIDDCRFVIENGKNEIIEILNARASTKGKVQRYDAMMEQINIRKAELSQRALTLKSEEASQKDTLEEAQYIESKITAVIKKLTAENHQYEQEVLNLQNLIKKQNEQLTIGQSAYHREASRLESLKNITERYDGYGNSIRKVMEKKKEVPGIRGVVADLVKVNQKYEIAIETALGGSIQNIVTDNEQTAKQMIGYLKSNKFGRATFLPMTSMNSRNTFNQKGALSEPGVVGLASELVTVSSEYEDLATYLLGRTLVVDHIDHAIAIGRKYKHTLRMVTIEGESLNPGGSMTGGAYRNNSNLLGRRREIQELESSVKALKSDMEEMQLTIEKNRKKRNDLREKIGELNRELQEQYIKQNTAKLKIHSLETKEKELQDGYQSLQAENTEILKQTDELKANTAAIGEELKLSEQREAKIQKSIEEKQLELDERTLKADEMSQILEKIHLEFSGLSQKQEFVTSNEERIRRDISSYNAELKEIQDNLNLGSEDIARREEEIEEIKKTVQAAEESARAESEQLDDYLKEKEGMNTAHKAFFDKRDALSKEMNLLDKECYRLQSQIEKLGNSQESQINYMWEEYEVTPNNALTYRNEELQDRAVIKKDITALKDEIRKLGDVNVNAIEDFKTLQERHGFLSTQYEDLTKAEATLMKIIEELDTGMRKQFTEKFKDIQREFDKAFKDLFGGGKGTLELMEDEDILEAGIKIISQPPGKKLQNMMQLSGGEKALTAIALLFAIQNLKPSPFCLLDEIEAALDDSNVSRYAEYLKKLTKNTQFIIITHRRGTMNAADRLYGITMQEKGVSTLVSVDLVESALDK